MQAGEPSTRSSRVRRIVDGRSRDHGGGTASRDRAAALETKEKKKKNIYIYIHRERSDLPEARKVARVMSKVTVGRGRWSVIVLARSDPGLGSTLTTDADSDSAFLSYRLSRDRELLPSLARYSCSPVTPLGGPRSTAGPLVRSLRAIVRLRWSPSGPSRTEQANVTSGRSQRPHERSCPKILTWGGEETRGKVFLTIADAPTHQTEFKYSSVSRWEFDSSIKQGVSITIQGVKSLCNFKNLLQRQMKRQISGNYYNMRFLSHLIHLCMGTINCTMHVKTVLDFLHDQCSWSSFLYRTLSPSP